MRRLFPVFILVLALSSCASAFDPARLQAVDATIQSAISQKKLPGGVVHVEYGGSTYEKAYGHRAIEPSPERMTRNTVFDAASLTKVIATAPSIWLLISDGKLELDAPAARYIGEMTDQRITVRHLLTHSSGLAPGIDLRERWKGYDEGVRRAAAAVPQNAPGAVFRYSDVNFILLGEIVRRVSGEPLDTFAARRIFQPLGMSDTGFRPTNGTPTAAVAVSRIAPTERTDDGLLRGVVHDPTARRMEGVAGHAGLFTTAEDVARFARALLGRRMFPAGLTEVMSPSAVAVKRTGGMDLDSAYSRPRGDHYPGGSFGHTGWTGTFFWVDPSTQSFYVFMSNRVHPDGRGSVVALQRQLGTAVAESLRGAKFCGKVLSQNGENAPACPVRKVRWTTGGSDVQNGIDVLHASGYEVLRGKRVGLITNQSGIDRAGNPTLDLLRSAPGVTLAAIFSPEHGIRGVADAKVADEVDRVTKLPVFSLYGDRRKPSAEQLAGLDALVFDVQDIGTRFYTYISTMGLAMEAAAEAKVQFVVLDRVNPIGGAIVEGPLREGAGDFVAWHELPLRHGMTIGELAGMFRAERKIDVDLVVISVRGWKRTQFQDEAGLPWTNPSPNMRSLNAATLYPGIGILERAISVGRGTETPFEILGAPYIEGEHLAREISVPGVRLSPVRFTPTASVHQGVECGGVRIAITDRAALRSVDLGIAIASALTRLYPDQFPLNEIAPLLRHQATLDAIRAGKSLDEIRVLWSEDAFVERRKRYLLY